MPLFLPLIAGENVDMVWLAIVVAMVLQTSFLTPPVGWALFFLKGVAPPEVKTRDIYVGIAPFVIMQIIAIVLVFMYPGVTLWLPRQLGW